MMKPTNPRTRPPDAAPSERFLSETAADVDTLVRQLEARLDDHDHALVHRLRLAAQTLGVASVASAIRRGLKP